MKNFLLGLSKLVLGIILAMLIMSLAGLSMARYFMTRMVEQPERPIYENDLPEADRPQANATEAEGSADAEPEAAPEEDFPEPEPELAPEPAPEPERTARSGADYDAYATTNLNVRSGPGTTFGSIGGVSPDEGMTVIGEEGGWLNVILSDGSEGWVSGNYVTEE